MILSGSRCRGIEKFGSDLDVVVDYKGNIREDDFFNILHEDGFAIAGIALDINPITEDKTGLLAEYLESAECYLKDKAEERKQEKTFVRDKIKQAKQISQDRKSGNIEKSKNDLLREAIKDAKEKAQILSEAAGVKLKSVVDINYSWGEIEIYSEPLSLMDSQICAAPLKSLDIDIDADDIDVNDTVTVVWEID